MPRRGHGLLRYALIAAAVLVPPSGRVRRTAQAACGTPGHSSCSGRSRTPRRPGRTAQCGLPGLRQDRLLERPLSSWPSRLPCLRWLSAPVQNKCPCRGDRNTASHPHWCARLLVMEVIVRLQDRALCASITCTTGTYAEPEGRVIFDHRHKRPDSAFLVPRDLDHQARGLRGHPRPAGHPASPRPARTTEVPRHRHRGRDHPLTQPRQGLK